MYAVRITHFFSENTEELQRFRNALVRISEGVESRSIPSESGECDYEVLQRELGILEDELETGRGFIVSISDMQEDTIGPFFIVQAQDCWRASPNVMMRVIKQYASIDFVYMEDEPSEGIICTNDTAGSFFLI